MSLYIYTAADLLPAKNDRLSTFAAAPMDTLPGIIHSVVTNLKKDLAPPTPLNMVIFHPAA